MGKQHATEHDLFAQFLGFGFHHHHRIAGRGNHQIELAVLHFCQ